MFGLGGDDEYRVYEGDLGVEGLGVKLIGVGNGRVKICVMGVGNM